MSGGAIEIDESAINNLRNDYKQHFPARPQKGMQQGRAAQRSSGRRTAASSTGGISRKTAPRSAILRNKIAQFRGNIYLYMMERMECMPDRRDLALRTVCIIFVSD